MKASFLLLAFLIIIARSGFAQIDPNHYANIVESLESGSAAYGVGLKGTLNLNSTVVGHQYLDSTWQLTKFKLISNRNNMATPARYNILADEFELQTTLGLRSMPGRLVQSYKVPVANSDSLMFVNAHIYTLDQVPLIGFLALLSDGKLQLLKSVQIEVILPTYKVYLDAGDKNTYLKQKEIYYFAGPDHALNRIKKKNEILDAFGDKKKVVSDYIDRKRLSIKEPAQLQQIFEYYNSL